MRNIPPLEGENTYECKHYALEGQSGSLAWSAWLVLDQVAPWAVLSCSHGQWSDVQAVISEFGDEAVVWVGHQHSWCELQSGVGPEPEVARFVLHNGHFKRNSISFFVIGIDSFFPARSNTVNQKFIYNKNIIKCVQKISATASLCNVQWCFQSLRWYQDVKKYCKIV